jgi:hypothetical protein
MMNLALSITMIKMITQNGVDLKNDFQSFRVTGVLNKPMPHCPCMLFFLISFTQASLSEHITHMQPKPAIKHQAVMKEMICP